MQGDILHKRKRENDQIALKKKGKLKSINSCSSLQASTHYLFNHFSSILYNFLSKQTVERLDL